MEHYVKMRKFASRMKFVLSRMWCFGIFVYICKAFIYNSWLHSAKYLLRFMPILDSLIVWGTGI